MSRNLIVCCDGTANQFGAHNTNVIRLIDCLERRDDQLVFYDPGIGTSRDPRFRTGVGRRLAALVDLAVATGLSDKVQHPYIYLMDTWQPGDRVFLFGFSRGAYTARVVAAMLHAIGLLPPRSQNLVPYALRLFKKSRRAREKPEYWQLCDEFRTTFSRPIPGMPTSRFPIHFAGVWDTVSSVGSIWNPPAFPFSAKNPSIAIARQAISIDERRAFYRQNLFSQAQRDDGTQQDLEQRWFAGVHSDIGGGYPEEDSAVWKPSFAWMVGHAKTAGLHIDDTRVAAKLAEGSRNEPWEDPIHVTLKGFWWAAEFIPKMMFRRSRGRRVPTLGMGRGRTLPDGAMLHRSVHERVYKTKDLEASKRYAPRNLKAIIERLRGTPPNGDVPYAP